MADFINSEEAQKLVRQGMEENSLCIDVDDVGYLKCESIPDICKVFIFH